MALPDTLTFTTPTSRTTGISSASLTVGARLLGSEIDNENTGDTLADIWIEWTCSSAPTAGQVIEVYLLYARGTSYEDGDTSIDPKAPVIGVVPVYADTNTHRLCLRQRSLLPRKFKILLKSGLSVSATVTVYCDTYRVQVVD